MRLALEQFSEWPDPGTPVQIEMPQCAYYAVYKSAHVEVCVCSGAWQSSGSQPKFRGKIYSYKKVCFLIWDNFVCMLRWKSDN